MIHHLYNALYAHHPKSNLLLPPYTRSSVTFATPPPPFPLVTTILLSVSMSLCLLGGFCLFFSCFPFYSPHMSENIWFLTFSIRHFVGTSHLIPLSVIEKRLDSRLLESWNYILCSRWAIHISHKVFDQTAQYSGH